MNIYHNLLLYDIYGSNFFVKAKLAKRESDDVTVKCYRLSLEVQLQILHGQTLADRTSPWLSFQL